ncbi:hypothetical protein [Verrucosispora sioxanthis]|uniref:hypothetical protein n=1 Tax=Verrucosispora sioxanthis TaxID=2499994 RepID=UPI001C106AC5|nr:hypothetical protein [Verrucosispora sioxanthis]
MARPRCVIRRTLPLLADAMPARHRCGRAGGCAERNAPPGRGPRRGLLRAGALLALGGAAAPLTGCGLLDRDELEALR